MLFASRQTTTGKSHLRNGRDVVLYTDKLLWNGTRHLCDHLITPTKVVDIGLGYANQKSVDLWRPIWSTDKDHNIDGLQ